MIINHDYSKMARTGRRISQPIKRWEYIESKDTLRGLFWGVWWAVLLWIIIITLAGPAHSAEARGSSQGKDAQASSRAVRIDMAKIAMIESSGNPRAWRKVDDSRGLYQITPICLKEYNRFHPKAAYSMDDLWNTSISTSIASWYLNVRIPQMLKHYKLADTVSNRLIAYNAGIGNAIKGRVPKITKQYLAKYFKTGEV